MVWCTQAASFTLRPGCNVRRNALLHAGMRTLSSAAAVGSGRHRLVFMGTPECAATSLKLIIQAAQANRGDFALVGVVTQPAAPVGRSKKPVPSPVHQLAHKHNLPVLTPVKCSEKDFVDAMISEWKPDLCVTAAFGQYLPSKFLAIPRFGVLNIHPSALPLYRGAAPVQRAIEDGYPAKCVSVLQTVKKMDAGPILSQQCLSIGADEKASDVLHEMFTLGTELLLENLPKLWDGSQATILQDDAAATQAPKIQPNEKLCHLDRLNATAAHNHVRAFSEWPGSWVKFRIGESETMVKLVTTTVVNPQPKANNNHDRSVVYSKGTLHLSCADGSVLGVKELQLPGKKVVDAASFANGLRKQPVEWVHLESGTADASEDSPHNNF